MARQRNSGYLELKKSSTLIKPFIISNLHFLTYRNDEEITITLCVFEKINSDIILFK